VSKLKRLAKSTGDGGVCGTVMVILRDIVYTLDTQTGKTELKELIFDCLDKFCVAVV